MQSGCATLLQCARHAGRTTCDRRGRRSARGARHATADVPDVLHVRDDDGRRRQRDPERHPRVRSEPDGCERIPVRDDERDRPGRLVARLPRGSPRVGVERSCSACCCTARLRLLVTVSSRFGVTRRAAAVCRARHQRVQDGGARADRRRDAFDAGAHALHEHGGRAGSPWAPSWGRPSSRRCCRRGSTGEWLYAVAAAICLGLVVMTSRASQAPPRTPRRTGELRADGRRAARSAGAGFLAADRAVRCGGSRDLRVDAHVPARL